MASVDAPKGTATLMQTSEFHDIVKDRTLPVAWVDLDAVARNVDMFAGYAQRAGKTIRLASKSIRHVGLMRRILAHPSGVFKGILCFTVEEAVWLFEQGLDDLIVAYPSVNQRALDAACAAMKNGAQIRLMVDHHSHLEAIHDAAIRHEVTAPILLDVDVALKPMTWMHLGARRSPLRTAESISLLLEHAQNFSRIQVDGVMTYESQVAGLPDKTPRRVFWNGIVRWMKRMSVRDVSARRRVVDSLLPTEGERPSIHNGGGTGSIKSTMTDPVVSEVTVGSGFLGGTLFDYYRDLSIEPAVYFALEVCRIPEQGWVTCLGGGPMASGAPGVDRLPVPIHPSGLQLSTAEGIGEVQTPLRITSGQTLSIGQPVVFRPPKSGELAARFSEYLMVENGVVAAVEPTYRGMGVSFL